MRGWWPIPALVVAALGFAAFDADSGLRTWWQLRQELGAVQARVAGLERDVASGRQATAELAEDEFAIERAIRERLSYVRPGETLVRLARPDASPRLP